MTYQIINPEALGAPKGWNNGMLAPAGGRLLFVAGQVASDPTGAIIPGDFVEQFGVALGHCITVVEEAGGSVEDIGRFTIFVADMDAYRSSLRALGPVYREKMGRHYPAMALVAVAALVDPAALLEMEATAVIP